MCNTNIINKVRMFKVTVRITVGLGLRLGLGIAVRANAMGEKSWGGGQD